MLGKFANENLFVISGKMLYKKCTTYVMLEMMVGISRRREKEGRKRVCVISKWFFNMFMSNGMKKRWRRRPT